MTPLHMIETVSPQTAAKPTDTEATSAVGEPDFADVVDDQVSKDQLRAEDDAIELVLGEPTKTADIAKGPNQSDDPRHNLTKANVDLGQSGQSEQTKMADVEDKSTIAGERQTKSRPVTTAQTMLEGRMPATAGFDQPKESPSLATDRKQITMVQNDRVISIPNMGDPIAALEKDHGGGRNSAEKVIAAQLTTKPANVTPQPVTAVINAPAIAVNLQDLPKQQSSPLAPDTESLMGLLANDRAVSVGAQLTTSTPLTAGAETARQVAQQIAAAVTTHQGRVTEIALNPEDLGRVRLTMTALDTTITLNVLAERPETTDLLRRHIDALAQEFRALGYDDINFSFSGDGRSNRQSHPETDQTVIDVLDGPKTPTHPADQSSTGLDLRL